MGKYPEMCDATTEPEPKPEPVVTCDETEQSDPPTPPRHRDPVQNCRSPT